MLSWQIGRVSVTRVVESTRPLPKDLDPPFIPGAKPAALRQIPWLYPDFVDEEDRLLLGMQALLVETPEVRLVVDTCMGTGRESYIPTSATAAPFLEELARAGWRPEDVDLVLCTHLHIDHVGWNTHLRDGKWVPTFPNARYLFGKTEYNHWLVDQSHGAPEIMRTSVLPIVDAGLADLVHFDHQITSEVRLIPTTGHTPGHVSVVIESQGQAAIITGDMVHHPCQIAHPEWFTSYDTDPLGSCETRFLRLAEWADEGHLIIGTHFAGPMAGYVRRSDKLFRFECSGEANASDTAVP